MTESQAPEPSSVRRATQPPAWAPWLLGLALPIALVLELAALAYAGIVFPLFDPTPVFVLAVVVLSRGWAGVSTKSFAISAVLAVVVLLEWTAWGAWYYFVVYGGSLSTFGFDELVRRFGNPVVGLMLLETVAMLIVFGRASIVSYGGVKKAIREG